MDLTHSSQPPIPAFISLGSNQGDSKAVLQQAIDLLRVTGESEQPLFQLGPCSSRYLTEPQLHTEQPFFMNQVARLDCSTHCTPHRLLDFLQHIEQQLGRVRTSERYGPRVIDLDIVLFGQEQVATELLTIPHARMHERAFVLVPLVEIAPHLVLPDGQPLKNLLKNLSYTVIDNLILQPPAEIT